MSEANAKTTETFRQFVGRAEADAGRLEVLEDLEEVFHPGYGAQVVRLTADHLGDLIRGAVLYGTILEEYGVILVGPNGPPPDRSLKSATKERLLAALAQICDQHGFSFTVEEASATPGEPHGDAQKEGKVNTETIERAAERLKQGENNYSPATGPAAGLERAAARFAGLWLSYESGQSALEELKGAQKALLAAAVAYVQSEGGMAK